MSEWANPWTDRERASVDKILDRSPEDHLTLAAEFTVRPRLTADQAASQLAITNQLLWAIAKQNNEDHS